MLSLSLKIYGYIEMYRHPSTHILVTYAMLQGGIPQNIPDVTCIFFVYTVFKLIVHICKENTCTCDLWVISSYNNNSKIYATSESKLDKVLKTTRLAMADIGLEFNEKKCAIAYVKRGVLDSRPNSTHVGESQIIESLKEGENYKFLGVLENSKHEDTLVLWGASKLFLQRLSVVQHHHRCARWRILKDTRQY